MKIQLLILYTIFYAEIRIASGIDSASISVNVTSVTYNSISVACQAPANTSLYSYKLEQRHNATNILELQTEFAFIKFDHLKSNVIYDVQVKIKEVNEIWSNWSSTTTARTAPSGCSIINYFTTPTFATIFLEQVPGASSWTIEYKSTRNKTINTIATPSDGPTKTYYLVVLTNLLPNTLYSVRARVGQIANSKNFTEVQSPYGSVINITTEKLSIFGRIILKKMPFNSTPTDEEKIQQSLRSAYKNQSKSVSQVIVLQLEPGPSAENTLCQHEIIVDDISTPPSVKELVFNESLEYSSPELQFNVGGEKFNYYYLDNSKLVADADSDFSNGCKLSDDRSWIFHDDGGSNEKQAIPTPADGDNPETVATFDFRDNGVRLNSASTNFFNFTPNTVYAIQHDYLAKICLPNGVSTTLFYDRYYTASDFTDSNENTYTISYTTGPNSMTNDITSVFVYPLNQGWNNSFVKVGFDLPAIPKAIRYLFALNLLNSSTIMYIEQALEDIDSSERIQIVTPNDLQPNKQYVMKMNVTTRLANGGESTSPESTFEFLTGPPKEVLLRIINVVGRNYKVKWESAKYATRYIINIRNSSYSFNVTKSFSTEYVNEKEGNAELYYNVSIATLNRFGMSSFSSPKSTIFWKFTNISNSSFVLNWEREPTDILYKLDTQLPTNNANNYTDNEAILTNLSGGIEYQVNISYLDASGLWELLFSTYQITVPNSPVNVLVLWSNVTSIQIAWDTVVGAQMYDISISGKTNPLNSVEPSIIMSGLEAGRSYEIKIQASNKAGFSYPSIVTVETDKDTPIIQSTSENLTSNSFGVRWTAALNCANYILYVTNLNTSSQLNKSVSVTYYQLTGLDPGSTYQVSVACLYETGLTPLSQSVIQLTVPEQPQNITALSFSNGYNFSVTWEPSFGANIYLVYVVIPELNDTNFATVNNSINLLRICADVNYFVTIYAMNAAGNSSSGNTSFHTDRLVPEDVVVTSANATSLTLQWSWIRCAAAYQITAKSETFTLALNSTNYKNVVLSDLYSGRNYSITIQAVYSSGLSNWTKPLHHVLGPGKPSGFILNASSTASVNISWNPVFGSLFYQIYFQPIGITKNITSAQINFDNLRSGRFYQLNVRAVNVAGPGENAVFNTTTTRNIPIVESTSENLSSTSFKVRWTEARDAQNYILYINNLNSSLTSTFDVPATETMYSLTGIEPGRTYAVTVEAMYETGISTSQTVHQVTPPTEPAELNILQSSGNVITVTWKPSYGAVTYYLIVNGPETFNVQVPSNNYVITDLCEDGRYNVTILSENSAGKSLSASTYFNIERLVPNGVAATNVTETTMEVNWEKIRCALKYQVIAGRLKSPSMSKSTTSNIASISFDDLLPGRNYSITVTAQYLSGSSLPSAAIYQITIPAAPNNMTYTIVSNNEITVSWNESFGATSYYVNITSPGRPFVTAKVVSPFYDIEDICEGTWYDVKVRASNSVGSSASSRLNFTLEHSSPPEIVIENITSSSMSLSWTSATCLVEYQVTVSSAKLQNLTFHTTSNKLFIGSLQPGFNYSLAVSILYKDGKMVYSDPIFQITAAANPQVINILNVTTTTVYMTWISPLNAWGYRIFSNQFKHPEITNKTSILISNLLPGHSYRYVLKTISNIGPNFFLYENDLKAPIVYVVTVTDSPYNLTLDNLSRKRLQISWSAPYGAVLFYISFTTVTKHGDNYTSVYETSEVVLKISYLNDTAKQYFVTVQAANYQGRLSLKTPLLIIPPDTATPHSFSWWIYLLIAIFSIMVVVCIAILVVVKHKCLRSDGYNVSQAEIRLTDITT